MSSLRVSLAWQRSSLGILRGYTLQRNRLLPCRVLPRHQTRSKHSRPSRNQPEFQSKHQSQLQTKPNQKSQQNTLTPDELQFPNHDGKQQYTQAEARRILGDFPRVRVRYVRPAIWAFSVSAGIYVFLAYLEARAESKPPTPPQYRNTQPRTSASPQEVISRYWKELDPISKLTYGIIAANGTVHLGSFLVPQYWEMLWHAPALNVNYSLFTSTFVHSGPFHLLFNMWACYNFMLPTAYSRLFEGNPYHTLSFFLATGVLSGYAQHLSTVFSNQLNAIQSGRPPSIWIRSGGASGALFGVFGAFCMQYPNAGVGIMFLPFSVPALTFLPLVMTFDLYGIVRGFRTLSLGHAAHLGGVSIGVAYSYFDGKTLIWKPLVRFFKQRLQHKA